jgi:hypothetical protein
MGIRLGGFSAATPGFAHFLHPHTAAPTLSNSCTLPAAQTRMMPYRGMHRCPPRPSL